MYLKNINSFPVVAEAEHKYLNPPLTFQKAMLSKDASWFEFTLSVHSYTLEFVRIQAVSDKFTHKVLCIRWTHNGYPCKSGIAWKVTWNYAYSPFKIHLVSRYEILILEDMRDLCSTMKIHIVEKRNMLFNSDIQ